MLRSGQEFQTSHQERTIAGQSNHRTVRACHRSPQRCRHCITHARIIDRSQESARPLQSQAFNGQKGSIAAICRVDRFVAHERLQSFEQVWWVHALAIFWRYPSFPHLFMSTTDVLPQSFVNGSLGKEREQRGDEAGCIGNHGQVWRIIPSHDRGIDIHMNQFPTRLHSIASCAYLGEAATDCECEVTGSSDFLHKRRRGGAKPTPEPKWMFLVEYALAFEGGGYRRVQPFGESNKTGPSLHRSQPQVKQRPAASFQHCASPIDFFLAG